MDKMDKEYGQLKICLSELIKEKGLNRNQVSVKAAMNWKQVDRYCDNDISRLDTFVLCKLCTVLECNIQDLLKFVPPENNQNG
jgi:putative transcriptional regulator